jgi:hypothetical protein
MTAKHELSQRTERRNHRPRNAVRIDANKPLQVGEYIVFCAVIFTLLAGLAMIAYGGTL